MGEARSDGLRLRRATAADTEALAAFNVRVHSADGSPNPRIAARTRAWLDGSHPTVRPQDFLLQEPRVILLDEPTAFLDLPRRVEITGLLRTLAHETGLAVLLSTHDLALALRTADTIWLVTADGRFVAGAPEDLALDGSLAATFRSADLAFDPHDGGFRLRHAPIGRARLTGHGLPALWAARLLERLGYAVVVTAADPVEVEVECAEDGAGFVWRTSSDGGDGEHRSLAGVAGWLRGHSPTAPDALAARLRSPEEGE